MKQPVHPILMEAIQRKREAGIKLFVWVVVATLALLVWAGGLAIAYALGGGEALGVLAGISLVTAIFVGPMGFIVVDPVTLIKEYLYYSRELVELTNEQAWNAQQAELAQLRIIMKEEEL